MRRAIVLVVLLALATLGGRQARAQQIEAHLAGAGTGLGGVGGIGSLGSGNYGLSAGLALGERWVLLGGIDGGVAMARFEDGSTQRHVSFGIPLDLKLYLRLPRAGAMLPTLRAGVRGSYGWSEGANEVTQVAAKLLAGLEYLLRPDIGINVESGLEVSAVTTASPYWRSLGITWLGGVVFHL
jgi:hypothetical protein